MKSTTIFGFTTYALKEQIEYETKNGIYPDIELGNSTIEIHLLTLNEENWVLSSLETLTAQPLYQKYHSTGQLKIILVDSGSEDNTVEVAKTYVDEILEVPRGIFTARNLAAEQSSADFIVETDAAMEYPEGWLNRLLRHFSSPEVVAATGTKLVKPPAHVFHLIGEVWGAYLLNHIWGDNVVFRREAFIESGGWREDIDQLSFKETFQEEFDFYRRLEKIGKVVHDIGAVVFDLRTRFRCYSSDRLEEALYCEMIKAGERF